MTPHPGKRLKADITSIVTLAEASRRMGMSQQNLNDVLSGRKPITAKFAARLEAALEIAAGSFLEQQTRRNLDQECKKLGRPRLELRAESHEGCYA